MSADDTPTAADFERDLAEDLVRATRPLPTITYPSDVPGARGTAVNYAFAAVEGWPAAVRLARHYRAALEQALRLASADPDGNIDWPNVGGLLASWISGHEAMVNDMGERAKKAEGEAERLRALLRSHGFDPATGELDPTLFRSHDEVFGTDAQGGRADG